MIDPVRRNLVAALAGGLGLAVVGAAAPAFGQIKRKPIPGEPLPGVPGARTRVETQVTFEGRAKLTGRVLFGQLQERLILATAGSAGATGRLIISAIHGVEVACWVSRPFTLAEGNVRLMHSGCILESAIFTETTDWLAPPTNLATPYEAAKPSVTAARRFMSSMAGRTMSGTSEGYAVMLLPDSGHAVCNVAQFFGSMGLERSANALDNRGFVRPPWSLPPLGK